MADATDDDAANNMVVDLSEYECYIFRSQYVGMYSYDMNIIKVKKAGDIGKYDNICIILDKQSQALPLTLQYLNCRKDVLKFGDRELFGGQGHAARWNYWNYIRVRHINLAKKIVPTNRWIALQNTLDKGHPFQNVPIIEIFTRLGWHSE